MQPGAPSRTALGAARHRAAHQLLERGVIFSDPLAVRIVGIDAQAIARTEANPARRGMRLFIAARTHFAEDALSAAINNGVRQLVVLGAGLDTYAYRSAPRDDLQIFEVDYPATQTWKRERLAAANIAIPSSLIYAPVDFETQTLRAGLAVANFDFSKKTFFTWLGVVPYLSEQAIWNTLEFIAGLAGGAHVVFDYADPPSELSPELRFAHDERAARVAALGEAWVTYFSREALHLKLEAMGFAAIEDVGPAQIAARYFGNKQEVRDKGGHVLHAATKN